MNISIVLVVVIVVITLTLVGLRTNSAVVFLALCAGSVLITLIGKDVAMFADSFGRGGSNAPFMAEISLLLLPAALSTVFLKGTIPKSKMLLQILPSLATVTVAILLVVPLLTSGSQATVSKTHTFKLLNKYQAPLILSGVFGSLLVAAANSRGKPHSKK